MKTSKLFHIFLSVVLLFLIIECDKREWNSSIDTTISVSVTTSPVSEITSNSAILGGSVSNEGESSVSEKGICYSTSENPTTSSTKIAIGNGTGDFSDEITGLLSNTTYYVRAYVITSQGTAYGNQISFNTLSLQLLVTPAIYDVPKESGSRVFAVSSNLDWQLVSDQSWCVPNVNNGKGNSPVVATFETNTAIGQRSATLTFSAVGVSDQVVVITQAGTEPPALTISPGNQNVTNAAGTTTFAITSNVSWTATSDQDWCIITNTSGSGDETLTINYEENTTNSQRIANLEITGLGLSAKTVTISQQSVLPTEGMVAYYPFNGNANDESSNDNNGTVHGAILTTDRFGKTNSAYSFDGSNDYIDIGDKFNDLTLPFTISAWIYKSSISQWNPIFTTDNISRSYYHGFLFRVHNQKIDVQYGDGGYATSSSRRGKISSKSFLLNEWVHVAATVRSERDMTIYINGIDADGYYDGTGGALKHSNEPARIGMISFETQYYNGVIDDIILYNRSLSEEEIQSLYHEGGWGN